MCVYVCVCVQADVDVEACMHVCMYVCKRGMALRGCPAVSSLAEARCGASVSFHTCRCVGRGLGSDAADAALTSHPQAGLSVCVATSAVPDRVCQAMLASSVSADHDTMVHRCIELHSSHASLGMEPL